jgi:S-DNA-T family DNA segregation ATPase FtsK/SpoIIIE
MVPLLGVVGCGLVDILPYKRARQLVVGFALLMVSSAFLSYQLQSDMCSNVNPGGCIGKYGTLLFLMIIDPAIMYMMTLLMSGLGLVLVVRWEWVQPLLKGMHAALVYAHLDAAWHVVAQWCMIPFEKVSGVFKRQRKKPVDKVAHLVQEIIKQESTGDFEHAQIFEDPFWQKYARGSLSMSEALVEPERPQENKYDEQQQPHESVTMDATLPFVAPPASLFLKEEVQDDGGKRDTLARERARNLESKLALFGITGKVISITAGPVVTLFEYEPARDVKVSKILTLEDDLSLALEAHSLRIIAPIPGRSVVGFEVSNSNRQIVYFSDIIAGQAFKKHKGVMPLVIGSDTIGNDVVVDLVDMPHLLVAGSTGSGKSVALNSMLTSMLCKAHPDEVQFILIDPKRLEFAAFADIAHLLFPIITEVARVPLVLRWAVKTMEERYQLLATAGVRHVSEYHKKYGIAAMPYMVIVIDELADLMMTSGRDVEELIARLAQMARAAGIHLIIATQRPSVDVITGLIKVNFPSRIACKVISKVDSRTILDCSGAEKLLGKGDMLFLNQKGILARVHGAYVKDAEIAAVVDYIKKQRPVVYQELNMAADSDDVAYDEDPLYSDVVDFVTTLPQVSISLLQRRFRIGYNRSARLIDTLEARGILMPADGGKFRKVLR